MAEDLAIGGATLYMEVRGEPLEGQKAVAQVIVNRWRSGRFGETISEICLRFRQFSGWNDESPQVTAFDHQNIIQFARAPDSEVAPFKKLLQDAIDGKYPDPTGGATMYFNPKLAAPKWNFSKLEKTVQIGKHVFYREKRQQVAAK